MTEIEASDINETSNVTSERHKKKTKGTIFGIIGVVLGVLAWLVLYSNQWLGLSLASLGFVVSFFGLKGRVRGIALGGLVICGTLLLVVGIMYAAFYYIFESIQ